MIRAVQSWVWRHRIWVAAAMFVYFSFGIFVLVNGIVHIQARPTALMTWYEARAGSIDVGLIHWYKKLLTYVVFATASLWLVQDAAGE